MASDHIGCQLAPRLEIWGWLFSESEVILMEYFTHSLRPLDVMALMVTYTKKRNDREEVRPLKAHGKHCWRTTEYSPGAFGTHPLITRQDVTWSSEGGCVSPARASHGQARKSRSEQRTTAWIAVEPAGAGWMGGAAPIVGIIPLGRSRCTFTDNLYGCR